MLPAVRFLLSLLLHPLLPLLVHSLHARSVFSAFSKHTYVFPAVFSLTRCVSRRTSRLTISFLSSPSAHFSDCGYLCTCVDVCMCVDRAALLCSSGAQCVTRRSNCFVPLLINACCACRKATLQQFLLLLALTRHSCCSDGSGTTLLDLLIGSADDASAIMCTFISGLGDVSFGAAWLCLTREPPFLHSILITAPFDSPRLFSLPLHSYTKDSHVPEDEGQHLQSVYPSANVQGGMFGFGFSASAHLTEADSRATDETAKQLFVAWSRFWKTDKRVLVEKSPPDIIKLRFFQRVFGEERTRFVVMLRHPYAVAHFRYGRSSDGGESLAAGCLAKPVRHWLALYQQFLEDLKHLNADHVLVLQFEHLMGAGLDSVAAGEARMQSLMDKVYAFLDLEPRHMRFQLDDGQDVTVPSVGEEDMADKMDQNESRTGSRRRLLEFHGSRGHIAVRWSDPESWIPDFQRVTEHDGKACMLQAQEYESIVNRFGYSLRNLTHVSKPVIAGANVLW